MTMIDEGIYLFFDNESCDQGDPSSPFCVIEFSNKFLQDIKRLFFRSELNHNESDEQEAELQSLSERKFQQYCKRTTSVRFVPVRSFLELELALGESAELVDCFRKVISSLDFHGMRLS
jgi:hypothetical protein